MKCNYFKISILFIFLQLVLSCKKKQEPTPAPEPIIELISISPLSVTEFKDSVFIKIKYKDSNGDLGEESPDTHSLNVKDDRLSAADTYHVKPLAPISDKNIPIEGVLTIRLNSLFRIGNGNSESTSFVIKIKDRSGHWSNEITTPQIVINK